MADRWADSSGHDTSASAASASGADRDGAGPAKAAPTDEASGADAAPTAAHEPSVRPTHNTVNTEKIRRRVDEYRASVRDRSDREKHAATKLAGYCSTLTRAVAWGARATTRTAASPTFARASPHVLTLGSAPCAVRAPCALHRHVQPGFSNVAGKAKNTASISPLGFEYFNERAGRQAVFIADHLGYLTKRMMRWAEAYPTLAKQPVVSLPFPRPPPLCSAAAVATPVHTSPAPPYHTTPPRLPLLPRASLAPSLPACARALLLLLLPASPSPARLVSASTLMGLQHACAFQRQGAYNADGLQLKRSAKLKRFCRKGKRNRADNWRHQCVLAPAR